MVTQKRIGIAALLIITGFVLVYVFILRQSDGTSMFAEHYEPYPDMINLKDRAEQDSGTVEAIMAKYKSGYYEDALSSMNNYLARHPANQKIRFYRGVVNLELDQDKDAIDDFEKVVLGDDQLDVQATWYLALAYLRLEQTDRAGIYLAELIQNNTRYDRSAQNMIDRLNLDVEQINDAFYYKITEDNKYHLQQTTNGKEGPQTIDERTLYLECSYLDKLPQNISYRQFKPLRLAQQDVLLKYGQKEIWSEQAGNPDQETKNRIEEKAGALIAKLTNVKESKTTAQTGDKAVLPPTFQNEQETGNLVELANSIQLINMKIERQKDKVEAKKKRYKKTAHAYQSGLQKVGEGLQMLGKDEKAKTIMNHAPAFTDDLETYFRQTKKAHLGNDTVPEWFVEEVKQGLSTLHMNQKPEGMPEEVFLARKKLHKVIRTVLEGSQKRLMADKGVRDEDAGQHIEVAEYEILVEQLADLANSKVELRQLKEQKRQTVANLVKFDKFTSARQGAKPKHEQLTSK